MEIKRSNNPKTSHRHGVVLKGLPTTVRRFLIENKNLSRWKDDMIFFEQLIRIELQQLKLKNTVLRDKFYFDWINDEPVKMSKLIKAYDTIDWHCAISKLPIKAKFNNFDLENFVHPEYLDALNSPMVDGRILKSSVEFRKHCKNLLLNEQKEFIRIVKKGKKS